MVFTITSLDILRVVFKITILVAMQTVLTIIISGTQRTVV